MSDCESQRLMSTKMPSTSKMEPVPGFQTQQIKRGFKKLKKLFAIKSTPVRYTLLLLAVLLHTQSSCQCATSSPKVSEEEYNHIRHLEEQINDTLYPPEPEFPASFWEAYEEGNKDPNHQHTTYRPFSENLDADESDYVKKKTTALTKFLDELNSVEVKKKASITDYYFQTREKRFIHLPLLYIILNRDKIFGHNQTGAIQTREKRFIHLPLLHIIFNRDKIFGLNQTGPV